MSVMSLCHAFWHKRFVPLVCGRQTMYKSAPQECPTRVSFGACVDWVRGLHVGFALGLGSVKGG